MIELKPSKNGVFLPVKVVPGASRTRYLGELDGRAKFAVAAPPEKGKANGALIAYLARKLGVRRQEIVLTQGETSPVKALHIAGMTAADVRRLLELDTK